MSTQGRLTICQMSDIHCGSTYFVPDLLRGNTRPCYNIIEIEDGRVRVFRKYPFKERELAVDFDSVSHSYSRHEERIDSEVIPDPEMALGGE